MRSHSIRVSLRAFPRSVKRTITILVDVASVALALLVTLLLQRDAGSPQHGTSLLFVLAVLAAVPVFLAVGLYQNVIRYMGSGMLVTVVISVSAATLLFWVFLWLSRKNGLSSAALLLQWLLTLLFVGGSRVAASEFLREKSATTRSLERTIIYGAGDAGADELLRRGT